MTAVIDRELLEAIESSLFLYPAVHGLTQDLGIPGLRGRISKVSHPLTNLCGDARFSDREADSLIERVRARYGDLAFGWVTGPSSRPADLPERLRNAGLENADSIAGMVLTDLAVPIEVNPAIRIREFTWPEATLLSEMMARAYGSPTDVIRLFNELLAATSVKIKSRGYFAYLDGQDEPAAWSFLVYLPDSPIVLLGGAATLEEQRGHGLYTALVARRIADARADGRTVAIIQADRRTSASICAKLGFHEVCGLEIFTSGNH